MLNRRAVDFKYCIPRFLDFKKLGRENSEKINEHTWVHFFVLYQTTTLSLSSKPKLRSQWASLSFFLSEGTYPDRLVPECGSQCYDFIHSFLLTFSSLCQSP